MESGTIGASGLALAGLTLTLFAGFKWTWSYPSASGKLFIRSASLFLLPFFIFITAVPVAFIDPSAAIYFIVSGVGILLINTIVFVALAHQDVREAEIKAKLLEDIIQKKLTGRKSRKS